MRREAEAVILDAFDAAAVEAALGRSKAKVAIDELTSLPKAQSDMPKYATGARKLRIEGGGNLFRAAQASGVRPYLQQPSGFFLKVAAGALADKSSPLDVNASPSEAAANVVMRQQNAVVGKGEGVSSFVHIHDAAITRVALLAASPGVYNLVDNDPSPQNVWLAAFAKFVGSSSAPAHERSGSDGNCREDAVYYATELSGASNAKAKGILGWKPLRLEWLGA